MYKNKHQQNHSKDNFVRDCNLKYSDKVTKYCWKYNICINLCTLWRFNKHCLQRQRQCGIANKAAHLEVDRAPAGARGQVYPQLGQQLLVLGHPVAQDVCIVGWDNGHFCKGNFIKTALMAMSLYLGLCSPKFSLLLSAH